MPKVTESKLMIKGISGREYFFDIYTLNTNFNANGGIYVFSKRFEELERKFKHNLIYCGKTEDLSTRFDNHHKTDCIKNNTANCICIKLVSTETERSEIEIDILKNNNFKCNEIFN